MEQAMGDENGNDDEPTQRYGAPDDGLKRGHCDEPTGYSPPWKQRNGGEHGRLTPGGSTCQFNLLARLTGEAGQGGILEDPEPLEAGQGGAGQGGSRAGGADKGEAGQGGALEDPDKGEAGQGGPAQIGGGDMAFEGMQQLENWTHASDEKLEWITSKVIEPNELQRALCFVQDSQDILISSAELVKNQKEQREIVLRLDAQADLTIEAFKKV
jgi:hypothetical protein